VSRDGSWAVTGSDDKTVRIWSLATGALLRTIRLPAGPGEVGKAYAVAISPDGALIAAGVGRTQLHATNHSRSTCLIVPAARWSGASQDSAVDYIGVHARIEVG
jgi:WD40 repeat protein